MSPTDPEFLDRGSDRLALHHYPSPSPTAPVAVVLPAMGAAARFYRPLAESLVAAGFAVVVADLRGTGDSRPRAGRSSRYGYADLADDVGAVLAELKADDRRVLLIGHSLGGQAGLLHLATTPDAPVDGIALVAAAVPYWRAYPRHGLVIWASTQAIGAVSTVLRFWPGWTFGGRQARRVMTDWARTARTGRFPGADAAVADVTTPVLAISIDGDIYTPHEAVDHTAAKLRRAPVRRERIARVKAEGRPAHFSWVRAPEPVTALIQDWFAGLNGSDAAEKIT